MRTPGAPLAWCAAVLLAAGGIAAAGAGSPAPEPEAQAVRTARAVQILRARVELASRGGFYLLVDPDALRARLLIGNAVLEEYPIEALEVGTPRRAFRRRADREPWAGRIWSAGRLSPERTPAAAPPPGSDPAAWVPPTPEDLFPAPARYTVRYEGLGLEVWTAGADGEDRLRRWAARLAEATRLLLGRPHDALRIRLRLDPAVAGSLFRGLPDGTSLLILPPGGTG